MAGLPSGGPATLVPHEKLRGNNLLAYAQRAALDAAGTADLFARTELASGGSSYPATPLGRRLQLVARAIKAGLSASTYYMTQGDGDMGEGSYDTHAAQLNVHATLLAELAESWATFLSDLRTVRLDDRVALLAFSEFGRRVEENASGGTDHGTAASVLLAGGLVRGGADWGDATAARPGRRRLEGISGFPAGVRDHAGALAGRSGRSSARRQVCSAFGVSFVTTVGRAIGGSRGAPTTDRATLPSPPPRHRCMADMPSTIRQQASRGLAIAQTLSPALFH